ncbi:MAG: hypothetical protein COV44_02240 [Deltaproteobacteria bacterium CG11_big_fil_rev_8_21_14_0_20_45_16]|nr:MAG: hypothetical protein COV44_02240 [Deltaproteobacteria bacterium CG11_big_fil_rev_8_21_14_0_20_45_16]
MFRALCNYLVFPIRRLSLPWRFADYEESSHSYLSLNLGDFPTDIAKGMSEVSLRDCLFYYWILEQIPWQPHARTRRALDLGSMSFYYAPALALFLSKRLDPEVMIEALEVDPYRRYRDFYRRGDYAHYYVKLTKEFLKRCKLSYKQGDWLSYSKDDKFDLITCFFPFLYADQSDAWGLPRSLFQPQGFYKKCLRQSDTVVFFHQGDEEYATSKDLLEEIGANEITYEGRFFENPWVKRKHPVYVLLVRPT